MALVTMESRAIAAVRLLVPSLFLLSCLIPLAYGATQCYDLQGNKLGADDPKPCNSNSEQVSQCCGPNDYCLSNGMCLDVGGDNFYSIHGCSDPTWKAPCQRVCQDQAQSDGVVWLWMCPPGNQRWCCGQTPSCCDNQTNILTLGTFVIDGHPGEVPIVSGTGGTVTKTVTSSPSGATSQGSPNTSSSSSSNNSTALGVGLGLGIPFALALIGAGAVAVWLIRKRRARPEASPGVAQAEPYKAEPYDYSRQQQVHPQQAQQVQYGELAGITAPQELPGHRGYVQ